MQQLGVDLPDRDELIDLMADFTSCHPNLVQWLCDKLINTVQASRITTLDLREVTESREFKRYVLEIA